MRTGRLIEIIICLVLGAVLTAMIARVAATAADMARDSLSTYAEARQKEEALIERLVSFRCSGDSIQL